MPMRAWTLRAPRHCCACWRRGRCACSRGRAFGGQRRRVEIARALLCPGGAVILDEPFTGLDAAARDATTKVVLDLLDGRTLCSPHMTSPTLRPSISRISPRSKY
ncbi:MAG: hypothetical protein ACLU37_00770 [Collinsella sp.]